MCICCYDYQFFNICCICKIKFNSLSDDGFVTSRNIRVYFHLFLVLMFVKVIDLFKNGVIRISFYYVYFQVIIWLKIFIPPWKHFQRCIRIKVNYRWVKKTFVLTFENKILNLIHPNSLDLQCK